MLGFFQVGADGLDVNDAEFFRFPLLAERGQLPLHLGHFGLHLGLLLLSGGVRLLRQLPVGQFELPQTALHFVDFRRHALQLHRQLAGRFVHQIDGLVRQEALRDIAIRQSGRGHERRVLDFHAVMGLVPRLEPAEDANRILHAGLVDVDRLEATFQSGVLFDVLAVFVQRRRADAPQLPAGQRRLEQVGGIGSPFRCTRTDDGVQFVDEQDHAAAGFLHFPQHRLEPFFEFAAELGPGDQEAHIQGDDPLVLQALRHVPLHNTESQPFRDGGLADARLADEDGVVLGAAGQDLHHAADFAIAPDDRIELAGGCPFHQIDAVFLQRLVLLLRALVRHPLRAADCAERAENVLFAHSVDLQQVLDRRCHFREREQ